MTHKIRVREASVAEVTEFVRLSSEGGLPSLVCDVGHVAWKHLTSPTGASIAVDILSDDVVCGRLWVTRRNWQIQEHQIMIGVPQDLLITQENRSLREIADLINTAFRIATDVGGVMFHGSNPNSDKLYKQLYRSVESFRLRASVIPIAPLSLWYRLIRKKELSNTFIDRMFRSILSAILLMLRGNVVLSAKHLSDELSDVFRLFGLSEACTAVRDEDFFRWRFQTDKSTTYTIRTIQIKNQIVGYVVWTDTMAFRVRARVVIDIVCIRPISLLDRIRLWLQVAAHDNSAIDLLLFIANFENPTLRRIASLPLLRVPSRLMPQIIPIYVRGDNKTINFAKKEPNWFRTAYFTLSDLDFF